MILHINNSEYDYHTLIKVADSPPARRPPHSTRPRRSRVRVRLRPSSPGAAAARHRRPPAARCRTSPRHPASPAAPARRSVCRRTSPGWS